MNQILTKIIIFFHFQVVKLPKQFVQLSVTTSKLIGGTTFQKCQPGTYDTNKPPRFHLFFTKMCNGKTSYLSCFADAADAEWSLSEEEFLQLADSMVHSE